MSNPKFYCEKCEENFEEPAIENGIEECPYCSNEEFHELQPAPDQEPEKTDIDLPDESKVLFSFFTNMIGSMSEEAFEVLCIVAGERAMKENPGMAEALVELEDEN